MDTTNLAALPSRSRQELVPLLHAVAAGDRAALSQLYRRTSAKLYGICLQTLASDTEAEDALQEIYVTVWRKAALYDQGKASPITWLAVLARNRCVDRLRRKRMTTEPMEAAANMADGADSALQVIEREEDAERLSTCLDELEDRQKGLIKSAFLEGLTYSQLAERTEVPLGTMKSWIRRGLLRLRGCLDR